MINYEVTKDGHIKSLKTKKNITEYKMRNGHIFVELHINGKKTIKKIAELVLTEFCGPQPTNKQIIFKDGNYHNVSLENLEWGSVKLKRCTHCKKYKDQLCFSKNNIYCRECTSIMGGYKTRSLEKDLVLSEIQKGYLAGFIDGEGCIYLKKGYSYKHGGISYVAGISIGNTNMVELKKIQQEINLGYLSVRKNKNPKHKKAMIWIMNANSCRTLLKQIINYLRLKKPQGNLLLEYLDLAKTANDRKNKEKYLLRVEEIYLEIKKLNKKGRTNE